jgi:hypothetical protein
MDTITTTLKREWFAKIVDGSKRVEYREIKPYWTSKLRKVLHRGCLFDEIQNLVEPTERREMDGSAGPQRGRSQSAAVRGHAYNSPMSGEGMDTRMAQSTQSNYGRTCTGTVTGRSVADFWRLTSSSTSASTDILVSALTCFGIE